MEITEVQIKPSDRGKGPVLAYCTIVFDECFVVRDLRIINRKQDDKYVLFVAMPSRRSCKECPRCNTKNQLGSQFCNHCGAGLPPAISQPSETNYTDIAHPIKKSFRSEIEQRVILEYRKLKAKAG